jgi:hypothetical protein
MAPAPAAPCPCQLAEQQALLFGILLYKIAVQYLCGRNSHCKAVACPIVPRFGQIAAGQVAVPGCRPGGMNTVGGMPWALL